ncbi:FUSC family protein [Dyella soli]|uniref:FUSC family protein n=1 Tax=Dyella soli TaxID=522319 RepID=A0A4R0YT69_9GAMM|nr:FUSC family protein [Dyella soli]TCI10078.1 FUSC family protein [Dyella soli]
MTTTTSSPSQHLALLAFLRRELAPRTGRMRAIWRIVAGSTLVVVLGMVFQIPIPAYMAYIVFMASREETVATLMTAIAGAVAATVAVALSLLFYLLDADEPALRVPLLAVSTFIAMFFARTSTLGPIAFLAGFVLMLSQTLIDDLPNTEYLVRFLLWLWVVVALPAFVTVLIDFIWGEDPLLLVRKRIDDLLRQTAAALEGDGAADPAKLREETLDTMALHEHACLWDKRLKARSAVDVEMFEGLATLLSLLCLLPKDAPAAARIPVAHAIDACRHALLEGTLPTLRECVVDERTLAALDSEARPVVLALARTASELLQGAAERPGAVAPPPKARHLFVADAFSNRGHVQFALKTTLAVTLAYLIYTLLDWPGIRTAVTTCFFVALGSMAEIVHKLSLRLTGALTGGAIAGFCIVYVLPHMTDIGDLSLLIAVVSALCAWVATSSELLAYAGMQMIFAFYLGVLQDYAPATDLTVLRDRLVGIVLGNILMSMIFSTLWPVSALQVVRSSASRTLGLLARLVSEATRANRPLRLAVSQELVRSHRLASLALFEWGLVPSQRSEDAMHRLTHGQLDRVTAAAFVVHSQGHDAADETELATERATASRWLAETAARTKEGSPPPAWTEKHASVEGGMGSTRSQREAMECLQTEIAHVAPDR